MLRQILHFYFNLLEGMVDLIASYLGFFKLNY